ncbi:M1 family metallopeptidase [Leptobacterium sp. I13]|uniref:M1 family metallopeptidase n=1 Tax=Leptobacterium meishanense TaxID=3128904 RepID=UPI0030EE1CC7
MTKYNVLAILVIQSLKMPKAKRYLKLFFAFLSIALNAQQVEKVDFEKVDVDIKINPHEKSIEGTVHYTFSVLKKSDSIFLDAKNMEYSNVLLNNKKVIYRNDGKRIWIVSKFNADSTYQLSITYKTTPKQAIYFVGWEYPEAKKQLWTQGQGKYTSHWLPSIDDMNDKMIFNTTITFPKEYDVIANGTLSKMTVQDSLKVSYYTMDNPMSSYLVALAIGNYKKQVIRSESGIPIELYYYPEDSLRVEPTYRYTKKIFDFLEKEIGVSYPWKKYKQIPVKDFLYAGMENTTATIFSDSYVIDSISFVDKNYVNVNAHELAHQWFGNLVTEKNSKHHWLHEGFASYYALLAEKEIFGEDVYYWKLYESFQRLVELSRLDEGESLLDASASSLTFYEKGAWALHALKERIGEKAFKLAVKNYLVKYQYKNVTVNEFIKQVEKTSKINLNEFVGEWLENKPFPEQKAKALLNKNAFMKMYLQVDCSLNLKKCVALLDTPVHYPVKQRIIEQLGRINIDHYEKGLKNNNIKVRQATIIMMDSIPINTKSVVEKLLQDASYITIEEALIKLWINFPESRKSYLEQTKNVSGFNDKSLRMLWLTLAMITPEYKPENTDVYYKELSGYTSVEYHFEVRQKAFQYLFQINIFNDANLEDLVDACLHPVWQFSKSSKQLLKILLKDSTYKKRLEIINKSLDGRKADFLRNILKEV